jgi:hypothetical protein
MRQARGFTISDDILAEIASTKGGGSINERVNELLKRALELERLGGLEQEIGDFFAKGDVDSARERRAYHRASKDALSRA